MSFSVSSVISATDKATAVVRKVEERYLAFFDRISEKPRKLAASFAGLSEAAGLPKFGKGLANIGRAAAHMGHQLKEAFEPLAALTAIGSLAGLFKMVESFSHRADDLGRRVAKIGGGTVEQFGELGFAAKMLNVEEGSLDTGMTKLNKGIAEAASGKNKDLAALFQRLGISARDSKGHLKNSFDLLPELADAFKRIESPALRTRMAIALFGKSGADMIPMLIAGREELIKLMEEARKHGRLTTEQVEAGRELDDQFKVQAFSIANLRDAIAAKLAPVLLPLLKRLNDWIDRNRELIAQKVEHAVTKLANALDRINWEGVYNGIKGFIDFVGRAVAFVGGWDNALIALALVMSGSLISAILGVGKAIVSLTALMWANPILALIAGIALSAYLIIDNWSDIVAFFKRIWDAVAGFFDKALDGIGGKLLAFNPVVLLATAFNELVEWLFGFDLAEAGKKLINSLIEGIKSLLPDLEKIFSSIFDFVDQLNPVTLARRLAAQNVKLDYANPLGNGALAGGFGVAPRHIAEAAKGTVDVNVRFQNVPPGTRVDTDSSGAVAPNTRVGYGMGDLGTY